ncbi:ArsR family transcriptional regulator [Flavobacteriaceae bacterium R38]|nr:ArsR family transcriptional regulator [Flavobacteriaceae bacterium R38]
MEFNEAKEKFVSTWGALGTLWGINKAMAQIHAILFISPDPLTMEDIMEELGISRGNASMNLRHLMEWGIVYKINKTGERKEYFKSEKDVTELARQIAKERSRREIQPTIKVLKEVSGISSNGSLKEEEFIKKTKELYDLADTADTMLNKVIAQEQNWITKTLVKILK